MIEGSFFPAISSMTGITGRAKEQFMRVICAVAGVTLTRRGSEIGQAACVHMAQDAFHVLMPTGQPEVRDTMAEPFPEHIHAVMTGQAFRAIRQEMRLGEDRVYLTVAGFTRVCCEGGNVIMMTVRAGERLIPDREPVSVQGKSQQLVRKLPAPHNGQRSFRSFVLGVAIPAFQFGIGLIHRAMQSDHALHLLRDLAMTVDAQIRHRG